LERSAKSHATWILLVRLLALVLVGLGVVILIFPAIAAPLFAIRDAGPQGVVFLRAIAVRDMALGIWLAVAPAISTRAAAACIAVMGIIPAGDLILVASSGGSALALLPHAASLVCLAGLAFWGRRL
jgi:hypothetical protein